MMDRHTNEITDVEAFFADARATPPQVPAALMQRVLEDAEALRPYAGPIGWRGWFRLLGGAPGVGGLVTATCVGIWLGVAPPNVLPDLAGEFLDTTAEFSDESDPGDLTGFGWVLEES
tara:strand:- start:1689 stop:2042 length:354 start_codon:yes stop_codon:yes gene_type:complete